MNQALLQPVVQEFLKLNAQANPTKIALGKSSFTGITPSELAEQINSRQRAIIKWPSWNKVEGIYWPPAISVEQSSSEATANLKFSEYSGDLAIDLTGGIGIDCIELARKFKKVIYVEKNASLSAIARHNFTQLGIKNIEVRNESAEDALNNLPNANLIFLDPSRRNSNGKVFRLSDCEPNVVNLAPQLLELAPVVLVKNSPLLDIIQAQRELNSISKVHLIALDNEMKDFVFECTNGTTEVQILTTNYSKNGVEQFSFLAEQLHSGLVAYENPHGYVYEPNVAILKSGGQDILARKHQLKKLHPNSHLYSSDFLIADFPGRTFRFVDIVPSNPKKIKDFIPDLRASVFTRNYPERADLLKKKLKIRDSDSTFIAGTTLKNNKSALLLLERIN